MCDPRVPLQAPWCHPRWGTGARWQPTLPGLVRAVPPPPRAPSVEVPWGGTGCDGPAVPGSPLVGVGTTQPHACKTPRSPRQGPGQGTVPPPSSSPSQSPAAFLPAAENVVAQGLDRTQSGVWTWPPHSQGGMDAERGSATNGTQAERGSAPSVTASVLSTRQDQPGMLQPG